MRYIMAIFVPVLIPSILMVSMPATGQTVSLAEMVPQLIAQECAVIDALEDTMEGQDGIEEANRWLASILEPAGAALAEERDNFRSPEFRSRLDAAIAARDSLFGEAEAAREKALTEESKKVSAAEKTLDEAKKVLDEKKGVYTDDMRKLFNDLDGKKNETAITEGANNFMSASSDLAELVKKRVKLDGQRTGYISRFVWGESNNNDLDDTTRRILNQRARATQQIELINGRLTLAGRPAITGLPGGGADGEEMASAIDRINGELAQAAVDLLEEDLYSVMGVRQDIEDAESSFGSAERSLKNAKQEYAAAKDGYVLSDDMTDKLLDAQKEVENLERPYAGALEIAAAIDKIYKGIQDCIEAKRAGWGSTGTMAASFRGRIVGECRTPDVNNTEEIIRPLSAILRGEVTAIDRGLEGGGPTDDFARISASVTRAGNSGVATITGLLTPIAWDANGNPTRSKMELTRIETFGDITTEVVFEGTLDGNPFAAGLLTGSGSYKEQAVDYVEGRLVLDCTAKWETNQ